LFLLRILVGVPEIIPFCLSNTNPLGS
jgi:hypothetical protein